MTRPISSISSKPLISKKENARPPKIVWTVARLAALLVKLQRPIDLETLKSKYGLEFLSIFRLNHRYKMATYDEFYSGPGDILNIDFNRREVVSSVGPLLKKAASLSKTELYLAVTGLRWVVAGPVLHKRILGMAERLKLNAGSLEDVNEEAIFGPYFTNREAQMLLAFVEARQEGHKARFRYEGDEPGAVRTVRPLSLRKDAGEWRLLAWDESKKALRVFKLVHVSNATALAEFFEWPQEVDKKKALSMDLSVYRPSGHEVEVKLKLKAEALKKLQHLFPQYKARPKGDAWVNAHLYSVSPEWVARALLPALGGVQVVSPPAFRKAFEDECRAVRSKYVS